MPFQSEVRFDGFKMLLLADKTLSFFEQKKNNQYNLRPSATFLPN